MGSRCTLLRPGLTGYQLAWQLQQSTAEAVRAGADSTLILLEHPPTYTLGARGETKHLLASREALALRGASVIESDRGGDITFHGPGQLVAYPVFDLRRFGLGPRAHVRALEGVVIRTLLHFGITGTRVAGRPGVWVEGSKIAAMGVRLSRGVSTHGFALNVNPDLSWFAAIVPCGIADAGVTSMERVTGFAFSMDAVERAVISAFEREFSIEVREEALMQAGAGSGL